MANSNLRLTEDFKETQALLNAVERDVRNWAISRELWLDSGFLHATEYQYEAPSMGGTYLHYGPLAEVIDFVHQPEYAELEAELAELLEGYGFYYSPLDYSSSILTPIEEALSDQVLRYDRWRWIQQLFKLRLLDIHSEVYEFFGKHPGALQLLHWREFEELLAAVFRNQGYYTELGPGSGDKGVDVRLFVSEAIPELVTFVQAKRFGKDPVTLDAVASLLGVSVLGGAKNSIFATSSRFLPSAISFASEIERRADLPRMELADADRVAEWCGSISNTLESFLSGASSHVPNSFRTASGPLQGQIVHASWGSTMKLNTFCIVEHEFPHELVLRKVAGRIVEGNAVMGIEVADPSRRDPDPKERFIAYKVPSTGESSLSFRGDGKCFNVWDGSPQYYTCD